MIMQVRRWLPNRLIVLVGDGAYAALKLALCCCGLLAPLGDHRMAPYWRSSTTPVTGYLESKITVKNGSLVLGNGTGFARIGAYFYNSELGPGSYYAYVGNVWGDVRIVLENDNTLTAKATLWKSTAPDQSAGETLLDQEFSKTINFDTEYTVSMELSGSQLIFRCNDEKIIYQIQTPVYTPYDPYQHLCTRIYPEEGSAVSVKALFDNVILKQLSKAKVLPFIPLLLLDD
jgi:hypothetical protein